MPLRALAVRAVDEANRTHDPGHAHGFPSTSEVPPSLVTAIHAVERRLGRPRPTTPGRPKRTLLSLYFRASGVDGMHAPFMLETLLNPDLTPPERPAVLAHEWAHLAGYAPEDDASFVGLLAALGADPGCALQRMVDAGFRGDQPAAAAGPTADARASGRRPEAGRAGDCRPPAVARRRGRSASVGETYDQYLKAQGIPEGIQNYSRIVQLLIGSGALDW